MSLLDRYIFRQTMGIVAITVVTLTAVVWLTQALRQFDLIASKGQSLFTFLKITMLGLPMFISVIAPVSLLISVLYCLSKLNRDSELAVICAAGGAPQKIMKPFIYLALIVSMLVAVVNFELVPRSLAVARGYLTEVGADFLTHIVKEGRFTPGEKGLTLYVRERGADGGLAGLLVHDARDPNLIITYLAETGQIVRSEQGAFLVMANGSIQRLIDGDVSKIQLVRFDRYIFDLLQFRTGEEGTRFAPRERPTAYLLNPDPDDPIFQSRPGKFRTELHERISSPLYPLMFTLIALASLGSVRSIRQNHGRPIAAAILIALVARLAGYAAANLSVSNTSAVILMYAIPIGVGAIAAIMALDVAKSPWLVRKADGVWR